MYMYVCMYVCMYVHQLRWKRVFYLVSIKVSVVKGLSNCPIVLVPGCHILHRDISIVNHYIRMHS